jgi:hypothetical protein
MWAGRARVAQRHRNAPRAKPRVLARNVPGVCRYARHISDRRERARRRQFAADVEALFVPAAQAAAQSRNRQSPIIIIQTLKGCGACMALKHSVNHGGKVRGLLEQFVAVHATPIEMSSQPVNELLRNVTKAGYYPAAYFLTPGGRDELRVPALNADPRFARSFSSDNDLAQAMTAALERVPTSSEREQEAMSLEHEQRVELR